MTPSGRPPKGVLLDLDDVLVPWNTSSHWQWAWRPQGPRLGERHVRSVIRRQLRAWDRRRWRALVGADPPIDAAIRAEFLRDTLHAIAGRSLPPAETDAVVTRFDHPAGEIETYDDAAPGLRRLAEAHLPVAVVTELPEAVARWALRRAGLASIPLAIHGDVPPDARLPGRAGFRAACETLPSPASETVFVGDLFWSDVRAAGRAGLTAYLLDRSDRFSGVDARRIASLAGVVELTVGAEPEPESAGASDEGPEPDR